MLFPVEGLFVQAMVSTYVLDELLPILDGQENPRISHETVHLIARMLVPKMVKNGFTETVCRKM
jgi:hypothetical protein